VHILFFNGIERCWIFDVNGYFKCSKFISTRGYFSQCFFYFHFFPFFFFLFFLLFVCCRWLFFFSLFQNCLWIFIGKIFCDFLIIVRYVAAAKTKTKKNANSSYAKRLSQHIVPPSLFYFSFLIAATSDN
jgi:hypothetical protein